MCFHKYFIVYIHNVLKCNYCIDMYWMCIEVYWMRIWNALNVYQMCICCTEVYWVSIECVFTVCIYYTSATPTDSQWPDTPKQMAVAAVQDCTHRVKTFANFSKNCWLRMHCKNCNICQIHPRKIAKIPKQMAVAAVQDCTRSKKILYCKNCKICENLLTEKTL